VKHDHAALLISAAFTHLACASIGDSSTKVDCPGDLGKPGKCRAYARSRARKEAISGDHLRDGNHPAITCDDSATPCMSDSRRAITLLLLRITASADFPYNI